MLATAIAIKLDSKGPVLFRQKRHGFNNEIIDVYKFRSMYADTCRPDRQQAGDQERPARHPGRPLHPQDLDRRTAAVLQRAVRLSVAGRARARMPSPRRSHNKLYNEVVDGYFARHRVKPGVTGWAQINGWRGEIDTDEKIRMRTEFDLN